jgi:hypothetical protein
MESENKRSEIETKNVILSAKYFWSLKVRNRIITKKEPKTEAALQIT